MNALIVSREEAGQKLLNFLQRRLEAANGELHKWIRSGQVRINGGRAKAFDRVEEGDAVRVPPFASARASDAPTPGASPHEHASRLPIVYEDDDILILNKAAGLPTQGGSGHADSAVSRLAAMFSGSTFLPAPVHRLDKDTSGLMLAVKCYASLRKFSDALAGREGLPPRKEYLAWIWGRWPHSEEYRLRDLLKKNEHERKMEADGPEGREAESIVRPLETRRIGEKTATLMLIRLLTGRTHQIRVQFSSRGYPLVGDGKYGRKDGTALKLHAFRLTLPEYEGGSPLVVSCLPPWKKPWDIPETGTRSPGRA